MSSSLLMLYYLLKYHKYDLKLEAHKAKHETKTQSPKCVWMPE